MIVAGLLVAGVLFTATRWRCRSYACIAGGAAGNGWREDDPGDEFVLLVVVRGQDMEVRKARASEESAEVSWEFLSLAWSEVYLEA